MTYTVGVVGAGIGAAHLEGFAALPERFRVKTVCDLDEVRGRSLADRYEGVSYTRDLAELLVDPDIEIVDICLPPHLHFQSCIDALEAGKSVVW